MGGVPEDVQRYNDTIARNSAKFDKAKGAPTPGATPEDEAEHAKWRAQNPGENPPPLVGFANRFEEPKEKAGLQTPTLTDILMRDVASGQVRSLRKGSRRATFSGGAMSPYGELPPLGS
jgi:hypothetical protein